ncbi:MAG: MopE-related protein, partial [Candidatus Diapherotrites archaeon]|nr:MopE-related protein [Candidatus Diapherotrites archaeon]
IWTTDVFGVPKLDFNALEPVYIRGSGFLPSTDVALSITTPDDDFFNGSAISSQNGGLFFEYLQQKLGGSYFTTAFDGVNSASAVFTDCCPGAAWTTRSDCGSEIQNENFYGNGEKVFINGSGFSAGHYSWKIKGKPGSASCDPNQIVASGSFDVNSAGKFCFSAYTVANNDCGEYSFTAGCKNDNYNVECVDRDNDTYKMYNFASCPSGNDCNDSNSSIHPTAVEVCNNKVDDDCDGKADCADSKCASSQYCALDCVQAKTLGLLTGSFNNGVATIVNTSNFDFNVGLAVYEKFDENIDNQLIFDYNTGVSNANATKKLTVDLPSCKYQIDLFCGAVLQSLNGQRYGSRLIAGSHLGGPDYCSKCGNGVLNSGEECDDGGNVSGDGCSTICKIEPLKIIANKIVCNLEKDLPNWGKGGSDITSTTAINFVNSHPGCYFDQNWKFQWAYYSVPNPGDHVGEVSSALGWHSFGPTDINGKASALVFDLNGQSRLWVREVFKTDFIHFSYNEHGQKNDYNYSAELYCHNDVLNYDNYDWIGTTAKLGKTYYCIAFNSPKGECVSDADCPSLGKPCSENKCVDRKCVETPKTAGTSCTDGLYCNGNEVCNGSGACVAGTPISCFSFDLNSIGTCLNSPDSNPFTWDFFAGFASVCNESSDSCTTGIVDLTHDCSIEACNAKCEGNADCGKTDCDSLDKCIGKDYYDFDDVANNCVGCGCEENQCGPAARISHNDARCTECQVDSDCSGLSKDYCDGSTVKQDVGKCVDFVCTADTSTVRECNDGLFCNGSETCSNALCVVNSAIDCNPFNLPSIGECAYSPDNNPFTWDFFAGFASVCNESSDSCTTGIVDLTHDCSIEACNAECEGNADCPATECGVDTCIGNDYYDYSNAGNSCTGCECSENQCPLPVISQNDKRCVECLIDSDCDKLDNDYCDGSTVKQDVGKCVDFVCTADTSTVRECNDGLFCNGSETCSNALCVVSSAIDCNPFDLPSVGECNYFIDGFPKTWDFFSGFESACNEQTDSCTQGTEEITSNCSIANCSAECESNSDCTPHLLDNYCYFDGSCSSNPSCECNYDNEFCPVAGTVVDGFCYWGERECSAEGCGLNKTPMNCYTICDPESGPVELPGLKTVKTVTGPKLECNYFGDLNEAFECLFAASGTTQYSLTADYNGPNTAKTYYRQRWKFDVNSAWDSWGSWTLYSGAFFFAESSIHELEYYSEDPECNIIEKHNFEIDIVDNSSPTPVKIVGDPKVPWNGLDSIFYPNNNCFTGDMNCWKVSTLTPIHLGCIDALPHPVGNEGVCFNVGLDGDYYTKEYCPENADFNKNSDGYCCLKNSIDFLFVEESEHNLAYYCEDALGNKGPVDDEKFKVNGSSFRIKLNKKWNLISVPFKLLDSDVSAVFKDIIGKINSVWTFDALSGQWLVFDPKNIPASNLYSIEPGTGYWVAALDNTELVLGGNMFNPITTPPSKPIKQGWNLIGYYGTEGIPEFNGLNGNGKLASCELYSLGESLTDKGWNSLLSYWEPSNPNQWKQFYSNSRLDPGAGYWLSATEDGVFTYPTTCGASG